MKYKTYEGRQILESRWLMQRVLGRELTKAEVVHHKDGDPLNNELSNLELTTQYDHRITHMLRGDSKFGGQFRRVVSPSEDLSWCGNCKKFLPKLEFSRDVSSRHGLQSRCRKCQSELRFKKLKRGPLKLWTRN
jgi:hypothetical protein